MTFSKASKLILGEIDAVLGKIGDKQVADVREAIRTANAVFVAGDGRSGLVARCLAVRLAHLGLTCHVLGEAVTPPLGERDVLVAVSGTGTSPITCARARLASKIGARVIAVTASEKAPLASAADLILLVPAAGETPNASTSAQYGGSVFEQSAFIALEAIVLQLQEELGQTAQQMDARHATVE